jgi:hypothetical protein
VKEYVVALIPGKPGCANQGEQVARSNYGLLGAILISASVASTGALACEEGTYTFTVLRNGDPVGRYQVVLNCQGDRTVIQETAKIKVRFLTIPVYSFEYQGRQVWKDGRAIRVDAVTRRDGDELDITVRANDDGYLRTVNGRVDKFDSSMRVLAFWDKETLNHHEFFSVVEDKTLNVSFPFLGWEKISVAGKQLNAEHYQMVGDEERDLWFDAKGRVAKIEFRRHGSGIAYVRDQIAPLTPRASCTSRC